MELPPSVPHHDASAPGAWRDVLTSTDELITVIEQRPPQPRDGVELLQAQLERACLIARVGSVGDRDSALLDAAATGQAAAIGAARSDGEVQITAGARSRSFPAAGEPISPGLWLHAWSTALVVRDEPARAALELPAVLETTGALGDAFWPSVLSALTLAAVQHDDAVAALDAAVEQVTHQPEAIVEPGYRGNLLLPLLDVARELARGQAAALATTSAAALRAHGDWYADDERAFDPLGLLALPVLGLTCRAADLGLDVAVRSDYAPHELVHGPPKPRDEQEVAYTYPTRRAASSDEVTWFLDLEGFPRDQRRHAVVARGDSLVASYDLTGAPGLARARLEVTLDDAGRLPGEYDLLDAGDLVTAADLLGARASAADLPLRQRRAWLDEAAACLAHVVRRLRGVERPSDAMFTPRGTRAYLAEPGRFDVERLEAVRAAWRAQIREWDREAKARDSRQSASVSLTALRLHLEPLLAALAQDTDGEVAMRLRPTADDCRRVFAAGFAADAARRYTEFWDQPWHSQVPTGAQSQILCHLAPAGMLGDDNELSRPFPQGYRQVAHLLDPTRVWAAWKYVGRGSTSGLAFDGLVWCDDHWAWFPRPYRVLRPLAER